MSQRIAVVLSDKRLGLVLLLAAALGIAGFLLASSLTHGTGFPLDDAWIHQTYARNLVQRGEWAFQAGEASAGSTAPLWSLALAPGYLVGLGPLWWSWLLGLVLLGGVGWVGGRWLRTRGTGLQGAVWPVGLLLVFEWHLIWAGLSGMETLLQGLLFAIVLWKLESDRPRWGALGGLVGLGLWIRPDALTLLLPLGLAMLLHPQRVQKEIPRRILLGAAGFLLLSLPYLFFNQWLGGSMLPSTFYAKQAEYAALRQLPLAMRWLQQLTPLLAGSLIVLLPGILLATIQDLRDKRWLRLLPLLWAFAFLAAYALRLPVTYQHGRYAIPVLPALLVLGAEGLSRTVDWRASPAARRLLSRAWILTAAAVTLAFYVLGARAYALDVAVIETEMVATARWLAENTLEEALIAAHDIGAIGYFSGRQLIDLAGLVSPEVIPILRDEAALANLLNQQRADYLVTFPGWYPQLVEGAAIVHRTLGPFAPALGGENMVVYRWPFAP